MVAFIKETIWPEIGNIWIGLGKYNPWLYAWGGGADYNCRY
jgi:hypothetical protein